MSKIDSRLGNFSNTYPLTTKNGSSKDMIFSIFSSETPRQHDKMLRKQPFSNRFRWSKRSDTNISDVFHVRNPLGRKSRVPSV